MSTYITFLAGGFICLLARALYAALYGPLASYPGPPLCAFTRLPFLWYGLRGRLPLWIKSLHDKHGPIVRVAPDELSFTDHRAWQDIYVSRKPELEKDLRAYGSGKHRMRELIMADTTTHPRLRRALIQGFSAGAIKNHQELIQGYADQAVRHIASCAENGDRAVDLDHIYAMTAFDIAGDLILGESPHLLSGGDDPNGWLENMWMHIKMLDVFVPTQYFWYGSILRFWLSSSALKEASNHHLARMAQLVVKRLSTKSRRDVWEPILQRSKGSLSHDEIQANAQLLMLGGTETTATSLSALTYYLLMEPCTLQRVAEEIRGAFDSRQNIDFDSVSRLPYLNACIDEVLRLFPPIPSGLPRVVPSGGTQICGKSIPPGVAVTVYPYVMHRDNRNFLEAESFRPERWLEPFDNAEFPNDCRAAAQPFLVGHRNCLGRAMALAEMRCIMAKILWHFDLHLCDESRNWAANRKMFIFWDKKPLLVQAVARQASAARASQS